MLGLVFAFIKNPAVIITFIVVGIALGVLYTASSVTFFKVIKDYRLWLATFVLAFGLGYWRLSEENDKLRAKGHQQQIEETERAVSDTTVTLKKHTDHRAVAQAEQDQRVEIIEKTPEGQKHDAVLDDIAKAQGNPLSRLDEPDSGLQRPDGVIRP